MSCNRNIVIIIYIYSVLDRTLAVFICRGLANESGRGIMAVFDLNCWYHCQMPLHPCWSPTDKPGYDTLRIMISLIVLVSFRRQNCPFLSVYELSGDEGCVLVSIMAIITYLIIIN